jgi:polygalacturonase
MRALPLACLLVAGRAASHILNIDAFGAQRASKSESSIAANGKALSAALSAASLGDTVLVQAGAGAYTFRGPIEAIGLRNLTLRVDGLIELDDKIAAWPQAADGRSPWLKVVNSSSVSLVGTGLIDGLGKRWWDASITNTDFPGLLERRPNMLHFEKSVDLLIGDGLTLRNSPHYHVYFRQCKRVTVRFLRVEVDRFVQRQIKAKAHASRLLRAKLLNESAAAALVARLYRFEAGEGGTGHSGVHAGSIADWLLDQLVKLLPAWALQPEDLNTDGIDPNGEDFHVHDVVIDNDDDSIAVKPSHGSDLYPCSRNMLFENLTLTGFGASIGSVPPHADVSCVRNITFRNVSMPGTGKGIYVKSNPECGSAVDAMGALVEKRGIIEGITYEDIHIHRPFWWSVWIGPQQQHEPGSALGRKCSLAYPLTSQCPTQGCVSFANITLRRVRIVDPLLSPGLILGNATNPMSNLLLDNVTVEFSRDRPLRGSLPWGREFRCKHAGVRSVGGTSPVPSCA